MYCTGFVSYTAYSRFSVLKEKHPDGTGFSDHSGTGYLGNTRCEGPEASSVGTRSVGDLDNRNTLARRLALLTVCSSA